MGDARHVFDAFLNDQVEIIEVARLKRNNAGKLVDPRVMFRYTDVSGVHVQRSTGTRIETPNNTFVLKGVNSFSIFPVTPK